MGVRRETAGFTLIELLIVVSIISILAAIAVPNFLQAQTRSKVARVANDARTLALAVEAYATDNNVYPGRQGWPPADFGSAVLRLGNVETRREDMRWFTTPIAYVSSLPEDIFESHLPTEYDVLEYYSPELVTDLVTNAKGLEDGQRDDTFGWVIFSVGPDGHLGVRGGDLGNYEDLTGRRVEFNHWDVDYDPTNGTTSPGNVFRFQKSGALAVQAFSDDD